MSSKRDENVINLISVAMLAQHHGYERVIVIMAAGIGSRFGGGIKQLEPVGFHDEIIMDRKLRIERPPA